MESKDVAKKFYEFFRVRDGDGMASLYADDVVFSDPVFPDLRGEQAGNMWRMLCTIGKDLRIEYQILSSSDECVEVAWDAWYTFSKTGRKVHNKINARLRIVDGRILEHHDQFDFWRWSRQALGPMGLLLGWSSIVRSKVQETAAKSLQIFSAGR